VPVAPSQIVEPVAPQLFWGLFILVVAVRLAWWIRYLQLSVRHRDGVTTARRAAWSALHLVTADRLQRIQGDDLDPDEFEQQLAGLHKELLGVPRAQRNDILLVGSLALAAWTQLAASSGSGVAARLSDSTRGLLFAGVIILIAGPMAFRSPGMHVTYMGLQTAHHVGYAAVLLSLSEALPELFGRRWLAVGVALAATIVLRDLFDVRDEMSMNKLLLTSPLASPPPKSPTRYLLVASEQASRDRLRLALEPAKLDGEEIEFLEAPDGNSAVHLAAASPPDLVVAEVGVGAYGGFGLTRDLKAESELACPVMLILERPQDDWLGTWSGADALVRRPIDPFALGRMARELVQRRRASAP
jgi:hypothetical protein